MTETRGDELAHPEAVSNFEEAWNLLLDLDDVKYLSNRDKAGIRAFVERSAARIKQSFKPGCPRWKFWCKEEKVP